MELPPPTRLPDNVIWDITYACPLRCAHCYSESGRRPSRALTPADRSRLADVLIAMGPGFVAFSGGEPLLCPDLLDLAATLEAAGIAVLVYTSGSCFDDALVARLAEVVTSVTVSIDGATAEMHDRLRGRPGSFARAVAFLEALAGRKREGLARPGFTLQVECSLMKSNVDQTAAYCREMTRRVPDLDVIGLLATLPVGLASRESFEIELLGEDDLAALRDPSVVEGLRAGLPAGTALYVDDGSLLRFRRDDVAKSARGLGLMHIEPDGRVRAVPIYEGTVGSLLEEAPETLWARAQARVRDPEVRVLLESIHTFRDWARVAREIDLRFAAPADALRIRRRLPY